jgi:hypothetical protein
MNLQAIHVTTLGSIDLQIGRRIVRRLFDTFSQSLSVIMDNSPEPTKKQAKAETSPWHASRCGPPPRRESDSSIPTMALLPRPHPRPG